MAKKNWNNKSSEAWDTAWDAKNIGNSLGAIGGGITGVVSAGLDNAKIADTSGEEALIEDVKNTQFASGSFDNLLADFDSSELAESGYEGSDVRGASGWQLAGNTLKGIASGAAAGTQIGGPWGAVAGAVIGLGSGLAGLFVGNKKARDKANELNTLAEAANQQYLNSFNNAVSNTQNTMFNNSLLNIASYGGPLFDLSGEFSNGLTFIDEGGLHSENPFGGVMVGIDQNNTPNLVEEGEIIYNDYVFSNRLKPTKKQLADGGFTDKYNDWTFAKIVEDLQKESSERPNDIISKAGLDDMMSRMITMQEEIRMKKEANKNKFKYGGKIKFLDGNEYTQWLNSLSEETDAYIQNNLLQEEQDAYNALLESGRLQDLELKTSIARNEVNKRLQNNGVEALFTSPTKSVEIADKLTSKDFLSTLRYASPLIHGATLLTNLKKPDYSSADRIESVARAIPGGSFTPIGDYLDLQEIDSNRFVNPILANAAANRRAIQDRGLNAGQTIAGLTASNYTDNNAIGNTLIQGIQANNQIKSTKAQFDRGTNQTNAQMGLQALAMDQQRAQNILNATAQASQMRNQLDAIRSQAISNSLTGLTEDLGSISREFLDRDVMQKLVDSGALQWTKTVKNGGMLTRRKK